MAAGTTFFLDRARLVEMSGLSRLPGWTNGHVIAHVARNAEGLVRLLTWAATGTETPMYESATARAAEIERDSGRARDVQLADVRASSDALDEAIAQLERTAWSAPVRSTRGRIFPAADVPWMRVKEVWLHAVDIGADMAQFPTDVTDALFIDVVGDFNAMPDPVGLSLQATDSGRLLEVGDAATAIRGSSVQLLAWLVGRSDGAELLATPARPDLPPWL